MPSKVGNIALSLIIYKFQCMYNMQFSKYTDNTGFGLFHLHMVCIYRSLFDVQELAWHMISF
jgi:hypothetical protein